MLITEYVRLAHLMPRETQYLDFFSLVHGTLLLLAILLAHLAASVHPLLSVSQYPPDLGYSGAAGQRLPPLPYRAEGRAPLLLR